ARDGDVDRLGRGGRVEFEADLRVLFLDGVVALNERLVPFEDKVEAGLAGGEEVRAVVGERGGGPRALQLLDFAFDGLATAPAANKPLASRNPANTDMSRMGHLR